MTIRLALLVAVVVLGGCAGLGGAVPTDPELAAVLELVNEARSQGATCGGEAVPSAPPLAHDPVLGRTAQKHS